jgi:phosphate transport system substrate-binding protein
VAPLVGALATEYRSDHANAPVALASGLGSSARIAAVADGRIDIAMASHGVDEAALARQGLAATVIARTAVVVGTNESARARTLTRQQVCDIFAGRLRNWSHLGGGGPDLPIRPLMRPAGEVDGDVAREGIPCLATITLDASVAMIERPDDMARQLQATPGAIGITSAPLVEQSGGRIVAVTLDGVAPTVSNVESGAYPLTRRAILIHRRPAPPAVREFLRFVRGAQGQRIIRANGAIPYR